MSSESGFHHHHDPDLHMLITVSDEWWCQPGHGDWCTGLEKYTLCQDGMYHKVQLLRTMLQWEEEVRREAISSQRKYGGRAHRDPDSINLGEVVIICWPHGDIMRLRTGSTAADAARRVGLDGKLVLVNGQLVLPNTQLRDGVMWWK